MPFDKAADVLRKQFLGSSYTYLSVADWWCLAFDNGLWVVAQNVVFPEEPELNELLGGSKLDMLSGVDPEYVAKGALLLRNMRSEITRLTIDQDGTLRLSNEHSDILFTTHEDIVDWQWGVNTSGQDPYCEFEVACFSAGEIDLKEETRS